MMTNRIFGKYLNNYIEGRGIPIQVKISVLTLLWLMIGYATLFIFEIMIVRILLLVIAVATTFYLVSIKTFKKTDEIH